MPSIANENLNINHPGYNFNNFSPSIVKNKTIALVGNPNVGKSVIFNALSGLKMDVSNYPGTTIEIAKGQLTVGHTVYDLIDTPGIYGVSSFNDEEMVAQRGILQADVIVNVVSALSLDRDLFLTLQLIDLGKPMVVVINQWDEAEKSGLEIDLVKLESALKLPIITTVATENKGIDNIKEIIPNASSLELSPFLAQRAKYYIDSGLDRALSILVLENDGLAKSKCNVVANENCRDEIYNLRRSRVNDIYSDSVRVHAVRYNLSKKLGQLLMHPFWGGIISFLVCYLIFYQLLGVVIAQKLVDITEKRIMNVYYEPGIKKIFAQFTPVKITVNDKSYCFPQGTNKNKPEFNELDKVIQNVPGNEISYNFWYHHDVLAFISNILVGEYGVLTLAVTYLLALLLPLVIGFYLGLSLLEDSGYLPRLAVLVDGFMNKIGLNGRAIIPLILGLGCVTMATITTRLLTTRREKIIATALLGVAIPCSAQLGVVSGVLAASGGAKAWFIYLALVFSMLGISGLLLNKILPGNSDGLMIDLPPMRLPRLDNVLSKTLSKSFSFLKESAPMFALASLVVTIAQMMGLLDFFIEIAKPATQTWLQLPSDPRIATTFILGIVRRDFASFGLTQVHLTPVQAIVAMIVITLFVPCIATVGVMIKERGLKIALTIWLSSMVLAFGVGGVLARVLPLILR